MIVPTSLERLRVFHAISASGTIAGAARALGYTPSAVSQHLAALEREAGTALVERSNRGVTLTRPGVLLASRSADILDLVRAAFDEVAASDHTREVPVSVAAFPTAITTLLLPLRERLGSAVRLTIVDAEPEAALRELAARRVECAITDSYGDHGLLHHDLLEEERLHRLLLRAEPIRLVTRSDRACHDLRDCADAPWVLGGPASRLGGVARRTCGAAGFTPQVIAETDDHHVTFDAVVSAGAVSLLPELALTALPEGVTVATRVAVPIERRIEFVTRLALRDHPAINAIAQVLSGSAVQPGDRAPWSVVRTIQSERPGRK